MSESWSFFGLDTPMLFCFAIGCGTSGHVLEMPMSCLGMMEGMMWKSHWASSSSFLHFEGSPYSLKRPSPRFFSFQYREIIYPYLSLAQSWRWRSLEPFVSVCRLYALKSIFDVYKIKKSSSSTMQGEWCAYLSPICHLSKWWGQIYNLVSKV